MRLFRTQLYIMIHSKQGAYKKVRKNEVHDRYLTRIWLSIITIKRHVQRWTSHMKQLLRAKCYIELSHSTCIRT